MAEVEPDVVDALVVDGGDSELTVSIITAMAKAYTRGRGFDTYGDPYDDVAAVIYTVTARFISNPKQTSMSVTAGPFVLDQLSFFTGWTLAELFVLNRHRKRAM